MIQWIQKEGWKFLLVGLLSATLVLVGARAFWNPQADNGAYRISPEARIQQFAKLGKSSAPLDFTAASELALPAVVHIRSVNEPGGNTPREEDQRRQQIPEPFRDFFDFDFRGPRRPQEAAGSGVILSTDGYIVTNNHVIEGADLIEVTLHDNRSFTATLIGADPSTDLALLKIPARDLAFLPYGDSEALKVGEWVLAVGNPFNLTSTVTAGIVSAKARSINILSDKYRIEAFIQTDAAVNPGNSGGALIATDGRLMGINTAIASRTGSYAGYSFAVPATIVKKVVDDLKKYGDVQRGFLGVSIRDVDADVAERENLKTTKGVFIAEVNEGSAAEDAGLEKGDVVTAINGEEVTTASELQEKIGLKRPGDQVEVTWLRGNKSYTETVTLKTRDGSTELTSRELDAPELMLGARLSEVPEDELADLNLKGGAKVEDLRAGKLRAAGMEEGFIITHIDKEPVSGPDQALDKIKNTQGALLLEGVYPNGRTGYYALSLE